MLLHIALRHEQANQQTHRLLVDGIKAYAAAQAQERCMLSGGDDYELLFTAPDQAVAALREVAAASGTVLTCIGRTQAALALQCRRADGQLLALPDYKAWQHFD